MGFDVAHARMREGGPALARDYYDGWWPQWERHSLAHRGFMPAAEYAAASGDLRAVAFVRELVRMLASVAERDGCARGSWRVSFDGSGATTEATAAYTLCLSLAPKIVK